LWQRCQAFATGGDRGLPPHATTRLAGHPLPLLGWLAVRNLIILEGDFFGRIALNTMRFFVLDQNKRSDGYAYA